MSLKIGVIGRSSDFEDFFGISEEEVVAVLDPAFDYEKNKNQEKASITHATLEAFLDSGFFEAVAITARPVDNIVETINVCLDHNKKILIHDHHLLKTEDISSISKIIESTEDSVLFYTSYQSNSLLRFVKKCAIKNTFGTLKSFQASITICDRHRRHGQLSLETIDAKAIQILHLILCSLSVAPGKLQSYSTESENKKCFQCHGVFSSTTLGSLTLTIGGSEKIDVRATFERAEISSNFELDDIGIHRNSLTVNEEDYTTYEVFRGPKNLSITQILALDPSDPEFESHSFSKRIEAATLYGLITGG